MGSNRRATIKDVAKKAGVSLSTASMALNGKPGVTDATRAKILAAAEALNYYGNQSARALRMSKSNVIGLILPDITNLYYSEIVEHVRKAAEQRGYFLLLGITGNKVENEKLYVSEFISRNVDGVILAPMLKHHDDVSHIGQFKDNNIPLIFLSAKYTGYDAPCVMCNLAKGAFEMTSYLLKRGLRRIALMTADKRVDNDYILGFNQAFKAQGLRPDNQSVFESSFDFEQAVENCEAILDWKPEAIFTISDLMACAVVQAARNRRIRIPQELSIAGYDDVLYASINQTPITTVRQPIRRMSVRALERLIDMIEKGTRESGCELMDPKIIIRSTTI